MVRRARVPGHARRLLSNVPAGPGAGRRGRPGCRRWWRWWRGPPRASRLGSLASTRAPSPSERATAVSASIRGVERRCRRRRRRRPSRDDRRPRWRRGPRRGRPRPWRGAGSPDAEQGELLPEQPLVRAAARRWAGSGRGTTRAAAAGPSPALAMRALVELARDAVGVGQHLAEELLLGVEVVVQQAGRDPGGRGRSPAIRTWASPSRTMQSAAAARIRVRASAAACSRWLRRPSRPASLVIGCSLRGADQRTY